jgi:Ca2+:H+ antiporter
MSSYEAKSEDGSTVKRRATIAMEEGHKEIGDQTEQSSHGASAKKHSTEMDPTNIALQPNRMLRSPTRQGTGGSSGLGGPDTGPPRRMTLEEEGRTLRKSFTTLLTPEKRLKPAPNYKQSMYNVLTYTWLNLLLLLIPVSWALHFALDRQDPHATLAIFLTSFLAIMPLAGLLSYGTEEVALRVGQTLGGLLNATLGNAVELIVAIIALFHCELTITQTSLIGSVLSNLLLVLGMCFFVGGLRYKEQEFKQSAAQLNTGLLCIAVISVLIPASFHATLDDDIKDTVERPDLLQMSRGASVILLIIYVGYLYFQLRSHAYMYADDSEEEEQPTLHIHVAWGTLVLSTVLVGVTSEWLVDSLDGFTSNYNVSKTFVGLVLLPIVSNAAEHVTAVVAARRNAVDLAMGVAVGSSIQIAIFVIPLLVIISWIAGKPLSLLFDPFVAILLFLAVLIVSYAIADGRSNYMEGYLLMNVFILMALAAWYVPDVHTLFTDEYCRNPVLAAAQAGEGPMAAT